MAYYPTKYGPTPTPKPKIPLYSVFIENSVAVERKELDYIIMNLSNDIQRFVESARRPPQRIVIELVGYS